MPPVLFGLIGDIGGPELILIFVLVLLLFGGQRLPDFARGLGKSIREFKKATSGVEEEIKRAMEEPPRPVPRPAPLPPPPALPEPHPEMDSEYLPPEALPPAPSGESVESTSDSPPPSPGPDQPLPPTSETPPAGDKPHLPQP